MRSLTPSTRVSNFNIHPKNWASPEADITIKWYLSYRFYDDALKQVKPVKAQLNKFSTLKDRQKLVRQVLDFETDLIFKYLYNPITGRYGEANDYEVSPDTPFIEAFYQSLKYMEKSEKEIKQTKYAIDAMKKAAQKLGLIHLKICEVSTRHLKRILKWIKEDRPNFGASSYNHYIKFLTGIYKELIQLETVDVNPARDLIKMKETKKIKEVLTHEERKDINDYFLNFNPAYHRFLHIFFHSGARIAEIVGVQLKHIDLKNLEYRVLIKKGKQSIEKKKAIKKVAAIYWEKHLEGVKDPETYLFSLGMLPGTQSLNPSWPTKLWSHHVKKKLGIKKDLYKLKHLNTTEISEQYSQEDAAALNSHTTVAMVRSIYDVKSNQRELNKLKKISNSFV